MEFSFLKSKWSIHGQGNLTFELSPVQLIRLVGYLLYQIASLLLFSVESSLFVVKRKVLLSY